ncbi:MAG: hypothetical protein EOM13_03150 [Clostridia bacterium]|nr:hypothetical protein [Clostridia bacterium]
MILHDIQIRRFGRLQNFSFQPTEGFQLIHGANEQGKSTFMAFIRAMLYGFSSDGRKLETSERQRYLPWDTQDMGGTLVFSHQGQRLRLERSFGNRKSADRTTLMNDISGEVIPLSHEDMPGFDVLGISEQEFVNTVFVRQMGSMVNENGDLLTRLINLAGSGSAQTSVADVAQRLRQAEADLQPLRGSNGRIPTLELELEDLRVQREQAILNAEYVIGQTRQLQQKQALQQQLNEAISGLRESIDQQSRLRRLERWQQIKNAHHHLTTLEERRETIVDELTVAGRLIRDDEIETIERLQTHWLELQRQRGTLRQQTEQLRQSLRDHQSGQPPETLTTLDRAGLRDQRNQVSQISRQAERSADQLIQLESLAENCREYRQELQVRQQTLERLASQYQMDLNRLETERSAVNRELNEHETERQALTAQLTRLQDDLQTPGRQQAEESQSGGAVTRWLLPVVSAALALAATVFALSMSQPLLWLAVPVILLPAVMTLIRKKQRLTKERQAQEQRRSAIQSQLSVVQGQLESSRRLYSSTERTVRDLEERVHDEAIRYSERSDGIKKDLSLIEAKLEQAEDRLNGQFLELQWLRPDTEEPAGLSGQALITFRLARLREEQHKLADTAIRRQADLDRVLAATGCTSWDQLEEALQAVDQYKGELSGILQQIQQRESFLSEADKACTKAADELVQALRIMNPDAAEAGEAADLILSLRQRNQQLASINTQITPARQFFNDLLDQRSFESWQQLSLSDHAAVAEMERLSDDALSSMNEDLKQKQEERLELESSLSSLASDIRQASRNQLSVRELDDQIEQVSQSLARMKQYAGWLRQARQALNDAADELQKSFGPDLNHQTGQILSQLTQGRYDEIKVDRSFGVRFADQDHRFHEWQFLSGGTADQVYLALRLAITDQITPADAPLPLLLDDVLIQYDDQRAFAALSALMRRAVDRGQQILFLTCQSRFHERVLENKEQLFKLNG